MATTKLGIFQASLDVLGHETTNDTGEPVESVRALVRNWDNVVEECLSEGSWNFAMETIKIASDTGVTPEFGFPEVFAKPTDWLRTCAVSQDENFAFPLLHYYDDSNYWSADSTPIYVRYVSNDTGLGLDLNRWPAAFRRYVELELAARVAPRLTQKEGQADMIMKMRDKARLNAKNQDAMNEANPKFPPPNSWTMSRGGRIGIRDRGSRGSLTG